LYFLEPAWLYHRATVDWPRNPDFDVRRDLAAIVLAVLGWTVVHLVFTSVTRRLAPWWVVIPKAVLKRDTMAGRNLSKHSEERKFETSAWKFFVFGAMLSYGYWAVKDEEWFMQPENFTLHWPDALPPRIWYHYLLTLAQYVHASFVIFFQPRQNDFVEMLVHHIVTIVLIVFSYVGSYWQIGSTLIIFTDVADPWMELAKVFNYGGYGLLADILLGFFTLIFIISRVVLFPTYCIKVAWDKYAYVDKGEPVAFHGLLFAFVLTLYGLFLYWTGLIVRVVYRLLTKGEEGREDVRDIPDEDFKNEKKRA